MIPLTNVRIEDYKSAVVITSFGVIGPMTPDGKTFVSILKACLFFPKVAFWTSTILDPAPVEEPGSVDTNSQVFFYSGGEIPELPAENAEYVGFAVNTGQVVAFTFPEKSQLDFAFGAFLRDTLSRKLITGITYRYLSVYTLDEEFHWPLFPDMIALHTSSANYPPHADYRLALTNARSIGAPEAGIPSPLVLPIVLENQSQVSDHKVSSSGHVRSVVF